MTNSKSNATKPWLSQMCSEIKHLHKHLQTLWYLHFNWLAE